MRNQPCRGVTLVELLAAMVIATIVAGISFAFLVFVAEGFGTGSDAMEQMDRSRQAMGILEGAYANAIPGSVEVEPHRLRFLHSAHRGRIQHVEDGEVFDLTVPSGGYRQFVVNIDSSFDRLAVADYAFTGRQSATFGNTSRLDFIVPRLCPVTAPSDFPAAPCVSQVAQLNHYSIQLTDNHLPLYPGLPYFLADAHFEVILQNGTLWLHICHSHSGAWHCSNPDSLVLLPHVHELEFRAVGAGRVLANLKAGKDVALPVSFILRSRENW
nr:prepilin-type N-terminal cleavage/methylation domain-containing protein [Desulfurispira natronophila]